MTPAQRLLLANKSWTQEKLRLDRDYFQRFADGQHPEFLWISCSDSRVPPNEVTGTAPAELFVHRNVANLILETDANAGSVIEYAVTALGVKHVIVCGHYGCGGVRAAMIGTNLEVVDRWISPVREIYQRHLDQLALRPDDASRWDALVELNVVAQVANLSRLPAIRRAWAKEARPELHGWVYGLHDGQLRELITVPAPVDEAPRPGDASDADAGPGQRFATDASAG